MTKEKWKAWKKEIQEMANDEEFFNKMKDKLDPKNEELIKEILSLREENAKLKASLYEIHRIVSGINQ